MATPRPAQLIPLCVLVVAAGCAKPDQQASQATQAAPPAADHRAADEAAIRANDSTWVKAVAAKNADQASVYYTDDAVLLAPGSPMMTGRDAIRKGWSGLMATPKFALAFAPDKVTVAGDLAYEVGSYEMTLADKSGKPQTSKGKYVVVWARQSDGSWKAVIDAPTTTQ